MKRRIELGELVADLRREGRIVTTDIAPARADPTRPAPRPTEGRIRVSDERGPIADCRARGVLTNREADLLRLVADGLHNKAIAEKLGISAGTVKVYLSRLYIKLGFGGQDNFNPRIKVAIWLRERPEICAQRASQRATFLPLGDRSDNDQEAQ